MNSNNILKDNSVVTDIAGDYTLVKTKNPTIAFQLVKLGFKLNEHDSFEKNKEDLRKKIIQVEKRLHEIIDEEDLNVGWLLSYWIPLDLSKFLSHY